MRVTKEQIKNGLVHYMDEDIVKTITDKPVMMVAAVITTMIKNKPDALDSILDNPMLSVFMEKSADGTYDLDSLFNAIAEAMDMYGNFDLHIPLVKSPFSFNKADVQNLKRHIEGGGMNA